MSFLDPDDYFLIMYYPPKQFEKGFKTLSGDDLKRIREAGPKTAIIQTDWSMLEPVQGVYNWDWLDKMVNDARQADMKILMQEYVFGPAWCPKEWYLQSATTPNPENQLSIWNKEAQDYLILHDEMLGRRYPGIQLVCSQAIVGESYLPFTMENPFCDPMAVKREKEAAGDSDWLKMSIIGIMLYRNSRIMEINKSNEIWHSAHYTIGWDAKSCGGYEGNGARYIPDVLEYEKNIFRDVQIHGIQYTYWYEGSDRQMYADYRARVREDRDRYGIDFYVEAGYCQGLPVHTPKLIEEGHKGFILAPLSPCTEDSKVEGWMIDNIHNSYNILNRRGK